MRKLIALGDSMIGRWNLSQYFANATNAGVGGQTSAQVLARLSAYLGQGFTHCLIFCGLNDICHIAQPPMNHVWNMAYYCAQDGMKVMLGTVLPNGLWESWYEYTDSGAGNAAIRGWNSTLEQYAADNGWHLVDFHRLFLNPDGSLNADMFENGNDTDWQHSGPWGYSNMSLALRPFL